METGSTRPSFATTLKKEGVRLERKSTRTVQINIGKLCNQACLHCHVEAGPKRTEIMESATVDRLIAVLENSPEVQVVDITGGAPELVPDFRRIVQTAHRLGKQIIDRCNLTVVFEPGQEDLISFLAAHGVSVIASLPCYSKDNVDRQRGSGTFDKSIEGLLALNKAGFGQPDSDLALHLVYNPFGPQLPPSQSMLESAYKERLFDDFGIVFHKLFTITNMPIKRYLHQLHQWEKYDEYMDLLVANFNPSIAAGVMCSEMISVGWRGELFDCDFNQELELPLATGRKTLWNIESFSDLTHTIAVADHCYGCTAGAGSSCGGALT